MAKRAHVDKPESKEQLREEFLSSIPERLQAVERRLAKEPDEAEESVRRLLEVWCEGYVPGGSNAPAEGAVTTTTATGVERTADLAEREEGSADTSAERELKTGFDHNALLKRFVARLEPSFAAILKRTKKTEEWRALQSMDRESGDEPKDPWKSSR